MGNVYIRSQDREKIVLFGEGFSSLHYVLYPENYAEKYEDIKCLHAILASGTDKNARLGFYETKERCLEVLDEIQTECAKYFKSGGVLISSPTFLSDIPCVYQMPEK